MGWKDKLTKSPPDPAQNALERIRAASAQHDEAPKTKWDALSDPVLETYAAAEEVLRPHAEAGTLAPEMILASGRHVGGVHFHPYDGATVAWRERTRRGFLIQDGKLEGETYHLAPTDITRIADYVSEHASELLIQHAVENIDKMKDKRDEVRWTGANETLKFWLEDDENRQLFNDAMRETLDATLDKRKLSTAYDISSWFNKVAHFMDDVTYGMERAHAGPKLKTLPPRLFADLENYHFVENALNPVINRIYREQKQLQTLETKTVL